MSQEKTEHKRITLGLIGAWIFGLYFLFMGFMWSLWGGFLSSLFIFAIAAILLPPVWNKIREMTKIDLSGGAKFLVIVILLIASFIVAVEHSNSKLTQEAAQVIDGPQVLTLTIDEVREELGAPLDTTYIEPTEEQQALLSTSDWNNSWEIDGHYISVNYDHVSREVISVAIGTNNPEGRIIDWIPLLVVGNFSIDSDEYVVEPIEAYKYPGTYTAIRAVNN